MKYFTISEMLRSDTARKHGIWNGATKEHEENLKALIEDVLDPLRELYGRPIHVTSGYRCPKLNNLVGGAPNSQHMRGEAADIVALFAPQSRHCGLDPQSPTLLGENKKLGQLIEALGNFDQLIYEQCDANGNPRWIHVSWKRNGWNRRQVLYR